MGTYVTENAEHISTVRQEMALQAVRDFLDSMAVLGISPEEAAEMIRKQEE